MMRKSFSTLLLVLGLFSLLLNPYLVFAAPLTGADLDLSAYINASNADQTTDANSPYTTGDHGDVQWPFNTFSNMYFGYSSTFEGIYFDIYAGGFGSGEPNMYYWNGTTWVSLGVDGTWSQTNPFTQTGIINYTFTSPVDWATTTLSTIETAYYYIKISSNGAQGATIDQISLLSSTSGGGTPAATPEFTDLLYGAIFLLGGAFIVQHVRQIQN